MARATTKPSITLIQTEAAAILPYDWASDFESVLLKVTETSESGAEVARKACILYLDKSDSSGLESLYAIACGRYTLAYQGKDYDLAKRLASAWGAIYDQASRKLSRHGFSLQAVSLRSVGSGNKAAAIHILTKDNAAAIKRDEEREKKERIEKSLRDHQAAAQAAAYDAMKSLTAADIADALRPMLSASGATLTDVIACLCADDGEAIRKIGKGLSVYKSLAEVAQAAEVAQTKRQAAAKAKAAAKAAAKAKAAEVA